MIACDSCSKYYANDYCIDYIIKFRPSYEKCYSSMILNKELIAFILPSCIAYQYNDLYFKFVNSYEQNKRLLNIAAKTCNKEVYEHQLLLKTGNYIKVEMKFDYRVYLPYEISENLI